MTSSIGFNNIKAVITSCDKKSEGAMKILATKIDAFTRQLPPSFDVDKTQVGRVVKHLKEALREYNQRDGIVARIFHAVYDCLFKTSEKMQTSINRLTQLAPPRSSSTLKFSESVQEFGRDQISPLGRVTAREDLLHKRDYGVSAYDWYTQAIKQRGRLRRAEYPEINFADLKSGTCGIDDLITAFENARQSVDEYRGEKDYFLQVSEHLTDVLSYYSDKIEEGDIIDVCKFEVADRLESALRNYNSVPSDDTPVGEYFKKMPIPRWKGDERIKALGHVLPGIRSMIESPECQRALKNYFMNLIQHRDGW